MAGESPLNMMRAERERMGQRGRAAAARASRPRLRIIVALCALVAVLAAGWCGLWYYAASVADRTLAGWVAREAAAGRIYTCGSLRISGFPFRIEAHCSKVAAALNSTTPPFVVAAKEITFTAQVYHPTMLVGDVISPVTVAAPGQPPDFIATWSQARVSVSGLPPDPDALSIDIDQPHLDRSAATPPLIAAHDADLQARIVGGTAEDRPVIDAVLHFDSATAPSIHPLLGEPLQGDVEVVLRGFKDLSPKPLADRFREMQAAGGNIEIKSLRIERADAALVGSGTLTVNGNGRLDGILQVAVYGLENIVPQLGIDKLIGQGLDRLTGSNAANGQGLAALDRLLPGLSGVVQRSANASVVDDLKKMGQKTEIDQKPAIALPLRFANGAVYLGIVRIGEVPALF